MAIRNIFALIFLTSSISKIKNYEEHIFSIMEYKIIPNKYVRKYAFIDVTLEFLLGLIFLVGIYLKHAFIGASLMLALYTIVISINVVRGRTDIDCGCGGIVGAHSIQESVSSNTAPIILKIKGISIELLPDFEEATLTKILHVVRNHVH
ncbi:MauE/DoxX family redox-associated membrane protein [Lysinibacillus sp. TE18511]